MNIARGYIASTDELSNQESLLGLPESDAHALSFGTRSSPKSVSFIGIYRKIRLVSKEKNQVSHIDNYESSISYIHTHIIN